MYSPTSGTALTRLLRLYVGVTRAIAIGDILLPYSNDMKEELPISLIQIECLN